MTAGNGTIEQERNELLHFFEKSIQGERRKKTRRRLCLELMMTAAVIFVLFQVIAGIAVVQGNSMKPNLTDGSVALFYRLKNTYRRNDIVIFRLSGKKELLIKRIVAVAGDRVDIDDKGGRVLVNGTAQPQDTIEGETYSRDGGVTFPLTVPNGCVFVLGDNREVALDSRNLGTIDVDRLIGKVIFEVKVL